MNTKILTALIAAALIAGCSATNKATTSPNGQPASATDAGYDKYENYQNSTEDQYLRMKVQNPSLWGTIDDYSYWNNSQYDFGYSCNTSQAMLLSSFYNPYGFGYNPFGFYPGFGFGYGWGSWYSPYQTVVLYKSPAVYFARPTTTVSATPATAYRSIPTRATGANSAFKATSTSSGSSANSITRNAGSSTRTYYSPAPVRSTSNFGSTRAGFGGGSFRAGGGGRH